MDKIKDILPGVIEKITGQKQGESQKIEKVWQEAIGKEACRHTKIDGINNGMMNILVDSSAWLFQMSLKKKSILGKIQKELSHIKKISFKIGKII